MNIKWMWFELSREQKKKINSQKIKGHKTLMQEK